MGRPRVFEHAFKVAPKDIDRLGHVNNVVYLRYAQDAAVAHWYSVVDQEHGESLVWVVRRHEIDYLNRPWRATSWWRTWVGDASGPTMERFIEIRGNRDGEVLASVRSVWVALDAKTLRPRRVTVEPRSLFLEAGGEIPAASAEVGRRPPSDRRTKAKPWALVEDRGVRRGGFPWAEGRGRRCPERSRHSPLFPEGL